MKINQIESKKEKKQIKVINTEEEYSFISDSEEVRCPQCGSDKVFGMSRVVGYFSVIENWNSSKKAELKRRQKGNYWHNED
ncbi:MAG: hypothetical protein HZR80_04480 [Candidatus Heimdallarchaeota archaeon]